jgi:uncharacterized membrane protein YhfC
MKLAPILVGAAVFFVFVNVLEGLMHLYFFKGNTYTKSLLENPWIYAVYGSLAAGLFEETGRLIAFKLFLKKHRSPSDGIAYGLGHGGIEFLLIGGLGAVSSLVMAIMLNNGNLESALTLKHVSEEQITTIKNSILNIDFTNVALGLFERSMALLLQVGMSMMVFYGVVTKKYRFYFFAISFHVAVDFSAALAQKGIISPIWIVELIIIPFAIVAILIAINLYKKMKTTSEEVVIPALQS